MDLLLSNILAGLKFSLVTDPKDPNLIGLARMVMNLFPRKDLPDWVSILANGNPESLPAVIETALAEIAAEELSNVS